RKRSGCEKPRHLRLQKSVVFWQAHGPAFFFGKIAEQTHSMEQAVICFAFCRREAYMNSSRLNEVLPFKSSALWKGVGLGAVACVLLLAVAIPNLMMARKASFESRSVAYLRSSRVAESENYVDVVHADAPKIIRKADLAMQVAN